MSFFSLSIRRKINNFSVSSSVDKLKVFVILSSVWWWWWWCILFFFVYSVVECICRFHICYVWFFRLVLSVTDGNFAHSKILLHQEVPFFLPSTTVFFFFSLFNRFVSNNASHTLASTAMIFPVNIIQHWIHYKSKWKMRSFFDIFA